MAACDVLGLQFGFGLQVQPEFLVLEVVQGLALPQITVRVMVRTKLQLSVRGKTWVRVRG